MKHQKICKRLLALALAAALLGSVCACGSGKPSDGAKLSDSTTELTAPIVRSKKALRGKQDDGQKYGFDWQYWGFSAALLRNVTRQDGGRENTLVSPLSVMTALAMTANGASGDTLTQMDMALCGDMIALDSMKPLDRDGRNSCLGAYLDSLPHSGKASLSSANSVWLKEGALNVKKDFLQTNVDAYNAQVFSTAFDDNTRDDINRWVSVRTGGRIEKMLDDIHPNAVMYLINALTFDAEWQDIYREEQVFDGEFTDIDGKVQTVPMMRSEERVYLDDGMATGFVKPYASGYKFVAMVPNEGVTLQEYVEKLPVFQLFPQLREDDGETVMVSLPKFSATYSVELSDALKAMGMTDAFDPDRADFSDMADAKPGDLYIGRVLHQTTIAVDEKGTKAGASTAVEMLTKGAILRTVSLDRPFLYMIVDEDNGLPVFIGQVTHF